MYKLIAFTTAFFLLSLGLKAQKFTRGEAEYLQQYEKNIKKSRINGVYIPATLKDAFDELTELSTAEARAKFKSGEERLVSERLSRGLGQWMIVNWNFFEGSRFSHYLKTELGVNHPEDMAQVVMIAFHRYLNERPLGVKELSKEFEEKRRAQNRKKD